MDKKFEKKYHLLEEKYWWFRARRDIIIEILKNEKKDKAILDIGCSRGALLKDLNDKGYKNVTGIDISKQAVEICNKEVGNCYLMDAQKLTFKKKFDIIIASDVLEHLKDDKKAIENWKSVLKKNGKIICFVPAFQSLWSSHDLVNHHFRRYSKKEILELFREQQMRILRFSFWNFSLFIPIFLYQKLGQVFIKRNTHNLRTLPNHLNNLLYLLLRFENMALRRVNFPFGVSLFIVAKNI